MTATTSAPDPHFNPLLHFEGLPRFDLFEPGHVKPAIERLLREAEAAVEHAVSADTPATWEAFVEPLSHPCERLSRAWGLVSHLKGVADSPEIREAYNAMQPAVTAFWTRFGQDERLYARYKAMAATPGWEGSEPRIAAERRTLIEKTLRSFRLGGAELEGPARERYAQIMERLAEISRKFSENVLDATNAGRIRVTDEARLAGLPQDAIQAAREEAASAGEDGWTFTLRMPSYLPVMTYARDRALREEMYRRNATRASEFGEGEAAKLDNGPLIDEILALRGEKAGLLGFHDAAELSLEPKMAQSPGQVLDFLHDLARRARPFGERDLAELRRFAAEELGLPELAPWDVAWASEKLKEARYAFSDQEVKPYFQAPRVLSGLFGLVQRLFGVRIEADRTSTWHPDVSFWKILDGEGRTVGQFYVDLYARATKRGGAWMAGQRDRRVLGPGHLQTPVAYLNCNFSAPMGGRPALLTHDEVTTLFHETGHGLHHLLTRVDTDGVAGIDGVEWDAVELPSQFMENFCWEYEVVKSMTAHVDTGEPLPRALFDKMLAARNFQAGLGTLRQSEFALFDMRIHRELATAGTRGRIEPGSVQRILDEVRREVALIPLPGWHRFQNSFSHIFAGGYAAGYYSYRWAEVLSADAYEAFEEEAIERGTAPNEAAEVGSRFLQEILAVGGSRPALDSFKAFRGREPRIEALLRHNGMVEEA